MICSWTCFPSSSAATLAQAFRIPTKVTGTGFTPSCCICWYSPNAFRPCPHFTCPKIIALQETTSCVGILLNTFQASSMFPHLAYMSTRLLDTKTSDSKPHLIICEWMRLPSSSAARLAHTFSTPIKVAELGSTPSHCICWNNSSPFNPCPHFTCPRIRALQETTSCVGIWLNTLQASSILLHFAYMSMRLLDTKISDSQPISMICSWTHLPSSSVATLAHAFRTPIKVTGTGFTPSCCICWYSSNALRPCPHLTCPKIMAFQVTIFRVGILLNTLQASCMLLHLAYM